MRSSRVTKTTLSAALAAGLILAAAPAFADPLTGNAANARLDAKGQRIEQRLDERGDKIESHLEKKAERAATNGHVLRADQLEKRAKRANKRLDAKGAHIEKRLDERGDRIDRRLGGLKD